jgi:hypothetical protein
MEMVFLVCGGRILEECSNGDGILGVWGQDTGGM